MVRKKAPCFPPLGFLYCFYRVPKEKKKGGERGKERERKKRTRKGGDLYNNGRGPSFVKFFCSQFQGQALFWVQLPRNFIRKTSIKMPTSFAK
jgi:hypothetical protein